LVTLSDSIHVVSPSIDGLRLKTRKPSGPHSRSHRSL